MLNLKQYLLSALLTCAVIFVARGQISGLSQFTIDNGLPSNTVYDISQDKRGFIWFATDYGVSKFDGHTFKNFTVKDGLPDNDILYFYKDTKDRIWLIGFNGTVAYIKDGKVFNKHNTEFLKELVFENYVQDIYEDSKGNIWFIEYLTGIKYLTSENIVHQHPLPFRLKGIIDFYYFIEDKQQQVYLWSALDGPSDLNDWHAQPNVTIPITGNDTWAKASLYKFEDYQLDRIRQKGINRVKDYVSMDLCEIANFYYQSPDNDMVKYKYIAARYDDGYYISNLNQGVVIVKNDGTVMKILDKLRSTRTFKDAENNIWIGSLSHGITLLPNQSVYNGFDQVQDLNCVTLHENKLYVGDNQGNIHVMKADLSGSASMLTAPDKTITNEVLGFTVFEKELFVLRHSNIALLNKDLSEVSLATINEPKYDQATLLNFKSMAIDKNHIYTASAGGLAKFEKGSMQFEKIWGKRTTALQRMDTDSIWVGTTSGLFLYDGNEIVKHKLDEDFDVSVVTDLNTYGQKLLVASNAYGLGVYEKGSFTSYGSDDGLLSGNIKSIHVDTQHNIWLATNKGLSCLYLNKDNSIESIKTYTISDGLNTNDIRSCFVQDDKCYVATAKGLNIINLKKENSGISPPRIHINAFYSNNKEIRVDSTYTFRHDEKNVEFNFSGISFKSLGNVSFKYRLIGLEDDWIETRSNNIRYSSLKPGSYTFEVKAIAKNKVESLVPATVSFTIMPPFYQQLKFVLPLSALMFSILGLGVARRARREQISRINEEKISSLRYQALMGQMNPHFIKNMLFHINDLIKKGEQKRSEKSIEKFSSLINLILKSTKSNLISLAEEMTILTLYIDLQKIRFEKEFDYSITHHGIDKDDLQDIFIPPMLLQPIVENCIVHGMESYQDGAMSIAFEIEGENLVCTIIDKGIRKTSSEFDGQIHSTGISIHNIKERLRLLHNKEYNDTSFTINPLHPTNPNENGTEVTLRIPYILF